MVWSSLDQPDGYHHEYKCESCRRSFTIVDKREMASGEWLMTLNGFAGGYIEIYRDENWDLSINMKGTPLKSSVCFYRSGVATLTFHTLTSTNFGKTTTSIFVDTSISKDAANLLLDKVKMNEELTKQAMESPAMKSAWRNPYPHSAPEDAGFYVGSVKGEQINRDIMGWLVRTLGNNASIKQDSGCYVATAVYGSYDCPQVWTLRRYRDNTLAETWYGRAFIRTYYAVSPTLVKWFGETAWFKKLWKGPLDRMVRNLNAKGVKDTPYQDKVW